MALVEGRSFVPFSPQAQALLSGLPAIDVSAPAIAHTAARAAQSNVYGMDRVVASSSVLTTLATATTNRRRHSNASRALRMSSVAMTIFTPPNVV
jgi:hypothetical protein